MNHLDRRGGIDELLPAHAHSLAHREHENPANALPARGEGCAQHRLERRGRARRSSDLAQALIDELATGREVVGHSMGSWLLAVGSWVHAFPKSQEPTARSRAAGGGKQMLASAQSTDGYTQVVTRTADVGHHRCERHPLRPLDLVHPGND